ncbi:NYN domain-containing protein [Pleionea sp. CnH1-48]|uniref:NYN domain-containing protein n=1 Tax=Pleionea sp. CnH1-48 TaxID=2954494 RepID=UPI0020975379|nr:NYN domain-containing protein [Pleionea sp. CnH1-48]MCO7227468.1 NYN domain-containing protein [Pleionea sp. CnH1-48]
MKNIALFADVQNIYYTTREAYGKPFNYRELWRQLSTQGNIVLANAYAIDRGDQQQQKFQSALRHLGFDVKLKPFIQRSDGSAKGDWDVGITIDVLTAAETVDRVILLSGDGDFDVLLNTIKQRHHVQADVYGVPALTAQSLMSSASNFYPITTELLL